MAYIDKDAKTEPRRPFHILSIEGQQKAGKTHLALTAPPPIGVQSLDFGTEGIVDKFEGKDITVKEYDLSYDFTIATRGEQSEAQAKEIREKYWAPFVNDAEELFKTCRTVVWDTATEVWEMLRLAYFGKLEKNPQLAYGAVNAEYKALCRLANTYRTNFILIHQQSKVYKNVMEGDKLKSIETDEWKRSGNNKIGYLVHTYVEQTFSGPTLDRSGNVQSPGVFKTQILGSRFAPQNTGMTLEAPDFETLMAFAAPHVDSWQ